MLVDFTWSENIKNTVIKVRKWDIWVKGCMGVKFWFLIRIHNFTRIVFKYTKENFWSYSILSTSIYHRHLPKSYSTDNTQNLIRFWPYFVVVQFHRSHMCVNLKYKILKISLKCKILTWEVHKYSVMGIKWRASDLKLGRLWKMNKWYMSLKCYF